MSKLLKGRTIWFWIACAAAIVSFVAVIILTAIGSSDEAFSWFTFVGFIIAFAAQLVFVFFRKLDFLPIVACVGYGLGLGGHLYAGLPVMSDVLNGVNFVGGTPAYFIAFVIIFAICTVLGIICGFMNQNKKEESAEPAAAKA